MASLVAGAEAGFEPIPGYVLRDKLGAGGYGEVWLADAPGGLKKAIKFVFGSVDEERAGNELKSLQRIRAVHHPFILSLERIEVVEGQLLVVTELADGSLLDRYREFHQRGLVGIPRDRLLEYMRDSADALDFLCQRHDLQHLDIKPANLLLVADRIKVADFGLIKDIQRNSMSMMGGMTPTYAAPEMFDGRPGRYSDQYSLALVYQEMLTGSLPFRGRTTAQLATEHLHKAPDLENLPLAERPVIARALAKKPSQRFGSCREMIDALSRAGTTTTVTPTKHGTTPSRAKPAIQSSSSASSSTSASNGQSRGSSPNSESFAEGQLVHGNVIHGQGTQGQGTQGWSGHIEPPSTQRREVVWLPPLDLEQSSQGKLAPSLFIGIGGTGAEVLTAFRSRLQSSGLDLKSQSDIGWLQVDTDEATLRRATDAGTKGRLDYDSVLFTPLKSSQQYRELPQEPFAPLSRRWLYNVPRSQLTEGVRPLAMLAYLDHSVLCYKYLSHLICNLLEKASATDQEEQSPEWQSPLRIYLVGSAHGATGSVFSIEFAFLIQRILHDLSAKATVQIVLTVANHSEMIAYELATSAGVACLQEIDHYAKSGGLHPGIPSLPEFHHSTAPWNYVYLVHGGKLGNTQQSHLAIDQITDFLCMDACTALGGILDHHRANTVTTAAEDSQCEWADWLRTFGSEKIDLNNKLQPDPFVKYLSLQVLQQWLSAFANNSRPTNGSLQGNSNATKNKPLESNVEFFVNDLFRENKWTAQSWVRRCTETLMISQSPSSLDSLTSNSDSFDLQLRSLELLESVDLDRVIHQLGLSIDAAKFQARSLLQTSTNILIQAITSKWLKSAQGWIGLSELLDVIRQRFVQQSKSLQTVALRFRRSKDELLQSLYQQSDASELPAEPLGVNPRVKSPQQSSSSLSIDLENQVRTLDLQYSTHSFAAEMLNRLGGHVIRLVEVWNFQSKILIDEFRLWSHSLASDLDISLDANGLVRDDRLPAPGPYNGVRDTARKSIEHQLVELVQHRFSSALSSKFSPLPTDIAARSTRADSPDTIDRYIDEGSLDRWIASGVEVVLLAANDAGVSINAPEQTITTDGNKKPVSIMSRLVQDRLAEQELPLLSDGGAKRSILMIPTGTVDPESLNGWKSGQNSNIAIVEMEGLRSAQLYTEGEQLAVAPIMFRLWLPTRERCQLAERLHSRTDIEWLPFQ